MSQELITEVDLNDNYLGLRPRNDFYTADIFHRSSALLLFNNTNELLLQKRSSLKKWFPGMYDFSAAGTVGDETYAACMKRETKEELGIELNSTFLFKIHPEEKKDKAFHSVFTDKTSESLKIDNKEVELVEWISLDNLKSKILLNPHEFTPQLLIGLKKYYAYISNNKK